MLKVNTLKLSDPLYPLILRDIHDPPKQLYYLGAEPQQWLDKPKVTIIGSRKATPYGKRVTYELASRLARAGVVIISGLAYGVDSIAHQAAVDAGGITVAVLPGSVKEIYPAAHLNLARQIVKTGGSLISEYAPGTPTLKINFITRNRIVSGLADAVLITEAAVNSGSLHTARFALEQGKTVMAVPGNINSQTSVGCNNLIKSGALPITEVEDIFFALNLQPQKQEARVFRGTPEEETIFTLIKEGVSSQEELALASQLDSIMINSSLTMLEIGGHIRPQGAGNWTIS
jgi:DNA processing protein